MIDWFMQNWIMVLFTVLGLLFVTIPALITGVAYWFFGLHWAWCTLIFIGSMIVTNKVKRFKNK